MTNTSECAPSKPHSRLPRRPLADDGAARAHIVSCESCRALLRDMERIRSRAATLPRSTSRDLWAGIEADPVDAAGRHASGTRCSMDEPALVRRPLARAGPGHRHR